MNKLYTSLLRKILFQLDAETAHGLSIKALKLGFGSFYKPVIDQRLRQNIAGLELPNPIGMAAGYDKNVEIPCQLLKLGFGFTEVGTLTPLAQDGNLCPRIFRLPENEALINRLGFNNQGYHTALRRLKRLNHKNGVIGVNIGANKKSVNKRDDYVKGIETFYKVAKFFTINISSPNTPGLRDMQVRENLACLLECCMNMRDKCALRFNQKTPVFLKIAPDLCEDELDNIAAEVIKNRLDGMIISNTTLSRRGLKNEVGADERGGLSGRPVFERSNIILAKMRQRLGSQMPIIGVGGVFDANSAAEKLRAGADVVQLYTGLIYQGPTLPSFILKGLISICDREGLKNIHEIRDQKLDIYANHSIPD